MREPVGRSSVPSLSSPFRPQCGRSLVAVSDRLLQPREAK
jgi:hypothetical protein